MALISPLTETLVRFCNGNGGYSRYTENRQAYRLIRDQWLDEKNEYECITKGTFRAVLLYMDKKGFAPSSVEALEQWVRTNPADDSHFEKSLNVEDELYHLKDYEPMDLDDAVLFDVLLHTARTRWLENISKTAASIAVGAIVPPGCKTNAAKGPDVSAQWLKTQLAYFEASSIPSSHQEAHEKVKASVSMVIPTDCVYGWLGTAATELETPLGFSYPAVLTAAAALIQTYPRQIRPTLYTCLIGPVQCGKSETIKRAIEYLRFEDPTTVKWTVPGSDRGLFKIFGTKKDDKSDIPLLPKTHLLAQDELRNTIAKVNINGSSLPSTLCSLWSMDEAGTADKTGEHSAAVRLNILGALKADDYEDFADVFGKETTDGLYSRFIYGVSEESWRYKKWKHLEPAPPVDDEFDGLDLLKNQHPSQPRIPAHCETMVNAWLDAQPGRAGRLGEIALRVAYISSAMNRDAEITVEAMTAALKFAEWQERIRTGYKAGLGETLNTKCTNAILTALEGVEPGAWVKWSPLATTKNWHRKFGASVVSLTRDSLAKTGMTIEEMGEDENGKPKRTGRLRLRMEGD